MAQYTDYDLIVLNRLRGGRNVCLIGEDVTYFRELIQMVYPTTQVSSFGTADILNDSTKYDFILFGDQIIREGSYKNYLYKLIDIGRGAPQKETEGNLKDPVILGIAKELSLSICCNAFIRCGFEILSSKSVRVMEGSEETNLLFELKPHKEDLSDIGLTSRYHTIYVLCPGTVKSGGAELLHQLVYHINQLGGNAYITYLTTSNELPLTHPEFEKYVYGRVRTTNDIIDQTGNALIIPEGWFIGTELVQNAKKLFWWLSVDNFLKAASDYGRNDPETEMRGVCEKTDIHLYQSAYAKAFVEKYNIQEKPVVHLGDYLNDTFIRNCSDALSCEKEDIVLFNPAKGGEFTGQLIEASQELCWRPIENLTTEQVQKLLRTAKVYIDFGNHPGKDRIPREAAVSGCIVITGRKGSAAFQEDVWIPEKYRMDEETTSTEEIVEQIRQSIRDYNEQIGDFEEYRKRIIGEKEQFISDVKQIFFQ